VAETVEVEGYCDPRFERVREAFAASFSKGEVGAGVSVTIAGEPVVQLFAGHADAQKSRPWERDTIVNVYSTTKGMTAICALRLVDEGRLDLAAPVAEYWPEFAQAGKQDIPVRYLLSHRAGLVALSRDLPPEKRLDWDRMVEALAAQKPWWEPGTKHGYHALTYGYLVGEIVRRVDGRSLGNYFREEIAEPLGADFQIGFGAEHDVRCADLLEAPPLPPDAPDVFELARRNPDSLQARVFGSGGIGAFSTNGRAWRAAEVPAANGHGTAAALARVYGALACGGQVDGVRVLSAEGVERATTEQSFGKDEVLAPLETRFGLGFMLTQPMIPFGPNPRSFGHPGAGGSIAFADPGAELGFGYVMNQMQMGLAGGTHGFSLIQEVYEALR
jgi:CubicO group peptidase (beta-lactamase class C family)